MAVAGAVQGTVTEFDEATGAGAVLLDDGVRLEFPGRAFAVSGLRLLRVGQRVRLERDDAGSVFRLTMVTMS
jgi:2-phospho-L-lactate/phosphoenolpyruvate guanylyltransferase